jgi:hypothetical protein
MGVQSRRIERDRSAATGPLRMRTECRAGRRIVGLPFDANSFRWTARPDRDKLYCVLARLRPAGKVHRSRQSLLWFVKRADRLTRWTVEGTDTLGRDA